MTRQYRSASLKPRAVPAARFSYQLFSVEVVLGWGHVSIGDFLANLAGIVGGVFTLMQLFHVFSRGRQAGKGTTKNINVQIIIDTKFKSFIFFISGRHKI